MRQHIWPRSGNLFRSIITIILVLTCLKVWLGPADIIQPAVAQIPNSGQQRYDMIDELKRVNKQLSELIAVMKTHTIKVQMAGGDRASDRGKPRR